MSTISTPACTILTKYNAEISRNTRCHCANFVYQLMVRRETTKLPCSLMQCTKMLLV